MGQWVANLKPTPPYFWGERPSVILLFTCAGIVEL
jgi:hypothetical protein